MARRKINIQRNLGLREGSAAQPATESVIDQLSGSMSRTDIGFKPTDQHVYEINLDRIMPDPDQPRHLLPYDLREALREKTLDPAEVMRQLVLRAEKGDMVALLVLGGRSKGPVDEEDPVVEDTGLFALARSIQEVGLRQPLNVYRIDDPDHPNQASYRLGEGERRFWAHHLLVQQDFEAFKSVRCIVEPLPENEEVIHQRQEAENAARVDLPALARARSMQRIKERLNIEMGTRVPGENTFQLPSQRDLQIAVGQRVKSFTGRAIGDRMVRNYLALLNLSAEAQDLAEAGQLTEKQLRPVMRLKSDEEQLAFIRQIIEKNMSGREAMREVAPPPPPPAKTSLREVSQTSVEQRFEKRVLDAAKTMHSLLTLPQENYDETINILAARGAADSTTRQALQSLRQTLEEILLRIEDFSSSKTLEVSLLSILPPVTALQRHLPPEKFSVIEDEALTGGQILERLFMWRREDIVLASRLEPFLTTIEGEAEALRAGEGRALPQLNGRKNVKYPDLMVYEVESGASIYWAHELLVRQGEEQFKLMKAEVVSVTVIDED
ncbi:MAG: ParB N-terminal domain-containing protein [Anaerolineae bacterium]|nr:ParB N-terminal domain-containing protein [Anaerolineae bacterium]MCB9104339.1 ParB N-terminal domain-containing protein [Anaerolineales bacterium]